jgi:hypothetical protein
MKPELDVGLAQMININSRLLYLSCGVGTIIIEYLLPLLVGHFE